MVSPTTEEQRMEIWDSLRERYKIKTVSSKEELIKNIRKKLKLRKYKKAKSKSKSLISLVKKSDFWSKSKYVDRFGFIKYKRRGWSNSEIEILKKLSAKYKGRELVREFNKIVSPKKSYMAIMVKKSRILRRR